MDTPTFLEVEVERDAVASVLDAVPGVAVADDATAVPSPGPAGPDGADDSGPSLTDRLRSLWRQWGLLGAGLSLIALGAATAGLWWYRRRSGDESTDEYASEWDADSSGETPPPAEPTTETPSPADTEFEPTAPPEDADETPTPEAQETALTSETPPGQSEGWRRDAEMGTERPGAAESPTEAETLEQAEREPAETDADDRPEAKVDPAPLLGAAFLILSNALGRWAARDRSDQP